MIESEWETRASKRLTASQSHFLDFLTTPHPIGDAQSRALLLDNCSLVDELLIAQVKLVIVAVWNFNPALTKKDVVFVHDMSK